MYEFRLLPKLKKHKDFAILSSEEVHDFEEKRHPLERAYADIGLKELEQTWYDKLEGNTKKVEVPQTSVPQEYEKKCIVM